MPSFVDWRLSLFNRKNTPCAVLQGGVFFGMFIAASQALIDPKAGFLEISHALTTLTLTYGALGENPYLWSALLSLLIGAKNRSPGTPLTLPKELTLGISVLAILGLLKPWVTRLNEDEVTISPKSAR